MQQIVNPVSVMKGGGNALAAYASDTLTEITAKDLEGATKIKANAFENIHSLQSVEIPGTVKSIGEEAFLGCSSLDHVTIAEGVSSVGNYAFGNTSIDEITFPASMSSYGPQYIVTGSSGLVVHMKASTPPSPMGVPNPPFYEPEVSVIYVPAGSLSAYQNASGWSQLANKIQEEL